MASRFTKSYRNINGTAIELTVGSNTAMVDGEEFKFDTPSMLAAGFSAVGYL